jgi:alkylation response protein AidB-like acyl-CoA dehydrogenase
MNPTVFPHPPDLGALADTLSTLAAQSAEQGPWRSGAFEATARSGLLAGFIAKEDGGTALSDAAITEALVAISARCLTTALVVTQWAAAVRILSSATADVRSAMLPPLARGADPTTVGISQLTTSRRHLGRPALVATHTGGEWRLDGLCPWVTGADSTRTIVTGAGTAEGGQAFFVVPTDAPGLTIDPPLAMLALHGSRTSAVHFAGVRPLVAIATPPAGGVRTGGLSTTALAVGAARASLTAIAKEAEARPTLAAVADDFSTEIANLHDRLTAAATDGIEPSGRDRLRADANGLVVRVAQAALTASKGAGFVTGHLVERLVRESLFFLVWSCPQAVADAFLCDLTS